MKYFLDTEFIEAFHKPLFGKRRHFIDLISIGLVDQGGWGFYAISTEFHERDASPWVKENVLPKLYPKTGETGDLWKTNYQIRNELLSFFDCQECRTTTGTKWVAPAGIEIYGYFADYDWVLFCSLFGTMMDLPEGFPRYCTDLKQMLDDKVRQHAFPGSDFNEDLKAIKRHPLYPAQFGEHNARKDAEWNLELYNFIKSYPVS